MGDGVAGSKNQYFSNIKRNYLVVGAGWWDDGIQSLEHGLSGEFTLLDLLAPALVPGHVGGGLDHVVTVPSGDWDEGDGLGVVADLLDVVGNLTRDFFETLLPENKKVNEGKFTKL